MANDMNQCNFTGRLGSDPESRKLPSGETVTNISIAVGKSWKDKNTGQKQERTTWVPVSIFGKLAEIIAQYAKKGGTVRVTGEFQVRKWTDNEGKDRYNTDINASDVQLLHGHRDESSAQGAGQATQQQQRSAAAPQQRQQQAPAATNDFDDDIPF